VKYWGAIPCFYFTNNLFVFGLQNVFDFQLIKDLLSRPDFRSPSLYISPFVFTCYCVYYLSDNVTIRPLIIHMFILTYYSYTFLFTSVFGYSWQKFLNGCSW
jgi:hypothetical protein